jgi:hypothetical protein
MHLNFKAERSTAEREPSSVAVRKLMVVCFTARDTTLKSDSRDWVLQRGHRRRAPCRTAMCAGSAFSWTSCRCRILCSTEHLRTIRVFNDNFMFIATSKEQVMDVYKCPIFWVAHYKHNGHSSTVLRILIHVLNRTEKHSVMCLLQKAIWQSYLNLKNPHTVVNYVRTMGGSTHASLRHDSKFFMNELADDTHCKHFRVCWVMRVFVVI